MELPITSMLLTHPKSRPALRPNGSAYYIREVKALVIHWTANTRRGADADANRNYFNLGSRAASAHYIVDDKQIVQCIPDHEVAFHCGDRPEGRYRPAGQKLISGSPAFRRLTPNYFTIGIEMCVNSDGDFPVTYHHTVLLTAMLLKRHGLTPEAVYRHFDITGKACPRPLITDQAWQIFSELVLIQFELLSQTPHKAIKAAELNIRKGPGVSHPIAYTLRKGYMVPVFEEHQNGWVRIGAGEWCNSKFIS
jgi:N-acetylmuramoyl-L-alanine amidase CwlA